MNKTISSEMTMIYKFIFPTLWIGGFGLGTIAMMHGDDPHKWIFLIALIVGTLFIGCLCFPLKSIKIEGSDLVISNYIRTIRVPTKLISNVTESVMINTHPVWIHFQKPTEFGSKVMFMPAVRMFAFFSSHPVVAELKTLAKQGISQPLNAGDAKKTHP